MPWASQNIAANSTVCEVAFLEIDCHFTPLQLQITQCTLNHCRVFLDSLLFETLLLSGVQNLLSSQTFLVFPNILKLS